MTTNRPTSTSDLLPTELQFCAALQRLGYGRFESLRIQRGELVLKPWPTAIQQVSFNAGKPLPRPTGAFQLKRQVVQFFEYVRAVEIGEISSLAVRDGLPISMEIVGWTYGLAGQREVIVD